MYVRACVRACVRARARVCVCICVWALVHVSVSSYSCMSTLAFDDICECFNDRKLPAS